LTTKLVLAVLPWFPLQGTEGVSPVQTMRTFKVYDNLVCLLFNCLAVIIIRTCILLWFPLQRRKGLLLSIRTMPAPIPATKPARQKILRRKNQQSAFINIIVLSFYKRHTQMYSLLYSIFVIRNSIFCILLVFLVALWQRQTAFNAQTGHRCV